MTGQPPKDQTGAWQVISVNINRQCSSATSVIVGKLLTPFCAHAHLPVIFTDQETRSWNVPELQLLGCVCYGGKFGLATLVVVDQFFQIKRSWRSEECSYRRFLWSSFCSGRLRTGLQDRFWIYTRHSSRMSPNSCGRDVEQRPKTSTSLATSIWSCDCFVQTTTKS